jgi:spermidine synthase
MIGLGGGGFNQFFQKAFPAASLDTVELDFGVLAVAQQHMAFKTSERNKVFILDGRMFLRRSNAIYDWIIVDAFRGGFVPSYLKTVEFYLLARSHLSSDGVLVANVHRDAALFPSDLRTMQAAFRQVGFFEVASTGNAVVAGANFSSPSLQELLKNAEPAQFNDVFRRNVDLAIAASAFHEVAPTVNKNATLLTDDFALTEF